MEISWTRTNRSDISEHISTDGMWKIVNAQPRHNFGTPWKIYRYTVGEMRFHGSRATLRIAKESAQMFADRLERSRNA